MATAKLYDFRGHPVDLGLLTKKSLAAPELAGIRTVWTPSAVTGMTPERLGQILAGVDANDIYAYLTLANEMEQRDLHYSAQLGTRVMAVKELELIVEAVDESADAVYQADLVRDVLASDQREDMVAGLMDAVGKGFSVVEMEWDRTGKTWFPTSFEWVDQRFFQFDRVDGKTIRLRDEKNVVDGIELAPFKFMRHTPKLKMGLPIRTGLARLAAVAFMCKAYALKDWLAFAEVFGMPLRVGKYQAGATDDEKKRLLTAVASIGTDAACIIEESMIIEFIEANRDTNGADKLFQGLADWLDSQVSKGVLGQTMTADNGSSLAQAKVHDKVRHDILGHDARMCAATIARDVVKPVVDLNVGVQERNRYPRVRFDYEEAEDLISLSKSLSVFIDRGLRVEEAVIRDKYGLPEPEEGALLLTPATKGQAKTDDELEDDKEQAKPGAKKPKPGNPANEDEEAAAARSRLLGAIASKIQSGLYLTEDERAFMVAITQVEERRASPLRVATARQSTEDEVDRLTFDALADWEALTQPLVEPIAMLAQQSSDYADFAAKLEQLQGELGTTDFIRSLATAAFKARGLGDATDEVKDV